MNKALYIFLLVINSILTCAQTNEQKIVAVGQAGQATESLFISYSGCRNNSSATKILQEIAEITRNDFSFYKHHLDVKAVFDNETTPLAINNIKDFAQTNVAYWIKWSCSANKFVMTVHSIITMKEVLKLEINHPKNINRAQIHDLNDRAYFSLFQKRTVFNSKIVFSGAVEWASRRSIKEIYIVDFDGYGLEKLTQHKGIALAPAFSPDNKKIIYSLIDSKKNIKNVELRELELSTGKSTLISDKAGMNSGAVYTSDGNGIYVTLSYGTNADIYYIDLVTKAERKVTNLFSEDVDPSITKDGKLMTFLSNRPGRAHVYTLDPSGTEKNVQRISFVGKFNATPRFSPDGSEIVFSSWVDRGFDLYRISATGNSIVRLTKNFGSNEDPTYSADGQFIVFSSRQASRGASIDQKIFIMNRDGEILGALTQNFKLCSSPRLSN